MTIGSHIYDPNYIKGRTKYRNMGIHNLVAYRIINSKHRGKYLFDNNIQKLITIFYKGLLGLNSTATFTDSYKSILLAARDTYKDVKLTRFQNEVNRLCYKFRLPPIFISRLTIIERYIKMAFKDVGIDTDRT
jgi:hypothetical protein